jgi:2-keto-4-pentenoate hydratase/2-oxohepta-3-ene-1,7-dioic acid hydratase in catechol pathway
MRLATIRPVPGAAPVSGVAIMLENGSALTVASLARIAGWPAESIGRLGMEDLIGADPAFDSFRVALDRADPAAVLAAAVQANSFAFAAPVTRPGKVVGVGYNYLDHIREQGLERPARPNFFSKFASSVVADGEPIRHPAGTHALDLEAELAVVIGRRASRVPAGEALGYVAGYTAANDVTARDWQGQAPALRPGEKGDGQWLRAKGSDSFLPLGPIMVTPDELGDGRGLKVRSWRTAAGSGAGEPFQMQDGNSADLLFGVAELISMISGEVTLEPGDVIVTGTPSGVGVFRDPPIFLEPGDLVRVEVEGIGSLTNRSVHPRPGSWPSAPGTDRRNRSRTSHRPRRARGEATSCHPRPGVAQSTRWSATRIETPFPEPRLEATAIAPVPRPP